MEISVRAARVDDCSFIVKANLALALETEARRLDLDVVTAGVNAVLADPGKGNYFVAEINGEVAGQLLITHEWSDWRNGDFWWIQSVYVSELFRGTGVFRTLYKEIRSRAEQDPKVCGLRLYVEEHNLRAQQAYAKLGMKKTEYQIFEIDFREAA